MKEPWRAKVMRHLRLRRGQGIPWRRTTGVASFWEYAGQTYRVRRHDGRLTAPPAPASDRRAP